MSLGLSSYVLLPITRKRFTFREFKFRELYQGCTRVFSKSSCSNFAGHNNIVEGLLMDGFTPSRMIVFQMRMEF